MANIRISSLPATTSVVDADYLPMDGLTTRKIKPADLVFSVLPMATQSEAEAGALTTKVMNPLTTRQAIEFRLPSSAAGRAMLSANDDVAQRALLGLGSGALRNVGSTAGTVAAGDDIRFAGVAGIVSQAVAEAATNNTGIMSPLRTKQQIDARELSREIAVAQFITDPTNIGPAIDAAMALIPVSSLDNQFAPGTAKVLKFPAGSYAAPGYNITSKCTGFSIVGEYKMTKISGLTITINDRDCSVRDICLTGAGDFGIKLQRAQRRYCFIKGVDARDRTIGILAEGGGLDSVTGCVFKSNTNNIKITGTVGIQFSDCKIQAATNDNLQLIPAGSGVLFGEAKFTSCIFGGSGRYNGYVYADSAIAAVAVECYFVNCTFTVASATRTYSISSIADAGGGQVLVTTSTAHQMFPGMGLFSITGTTDYNGDSYYVDEVVSPTSFKITKAWTSSQTGTVSMPNWDMYFDSSVASPTHQINDFFFTNCNINYTYINKVHNLNFVNCRPKIQTWMQGQSSRVFFVQNLRGRQQDTFADLPVSGPGSTTGWAALGYSGDNSSTPGNGGISMIAPNKGTALGSNNLPTLNRFDVKEDRINARIAGQSLMDLRENVVTLGGASGESGLRVRRAANAVNGFDIVGGATGIAASLSAIGETNASMNINAREAGSISLNTGGVTRLQVAGTASTFTGPVSGPTPAADDSSANLAPTIWVGARLEETTAELVATVSTMIAAGFVRYATRAELYANLVPGDGAQGEVYDDPTPDYIGTYTKIGATTTGSWTKTSSDTLSAVAAKVVDLDQIIKRSAAEPAAQVRDITGNVLMQLLNDGAIKTRLLDMASASEGLSLKDAEGSVGLRFDESGLNVALARVGRALFGASAELSEGLSGDLIVRDAAGNVALALKQGVLYVNEVRTTVGSANGDFTPGEIAALSAEAVALSAGADRQAETAPPVLDRDYNIIVVYSQSLGIGQEAWPCKTTTGRSDVLMIGESVRPGGSNGATAPTPLTDTTLRPAVATVQVRTTGVALDAAAQAALTPGDDALGEEIGVAGAQALRQLQLQSLGLSEMNDKKLIVVNVGVSGRSIEELSKGASPHYYNRILTMLGAINTAIGSDTAQVAAVWFLQGEDNYAADGGSADKDTYKAALKQLRADIAADAASIFGQTVAPAMITYQTSGTYVVDATDMSIGRAQLELATEEPGWYLAGPSYPVTDKGGHLDANGTRWLAMAFARATHTALVRRRPWKPVMPSKAVWRGRTVLVAFQTPSGSALQFRSVYAGSVATDYAAKGFTVTDSGGTVAITGVTIGGSGVVKIDLARTLTGTVTVRGGTQTASSGAVNLCDSDSSTPFFNYTYSGGSGDYVAANIASLVGKPYPSNNWCVNFTITAEAN